MKQRRMSCFEHASYNYSESSPNFFAGCITVEKQFSLEEVKFALKKSQKKFYLSRCTIQRDKDNNPWFIENCNSEIPIKHLTKENDEQWRDICQQELSIGFSPKNPLFRVILLTNKSETDIILAGHHTIGDGYCVTSFYRSIIEFLDNPDKAVDPYEIFPPVEKLIPEKTYNSLKNKCKDQIDSFFNQIEKIPEIKLSKVATGEDTVIFKEKKYKMFNWKLDKKLTKQMLLKIKSEKVTVHHFISAVLLKAFYVSSTCIDKSYGLSQSPISLRPYFNQDVGESLSCYISFIFAKIFWKENNEIWEMARELKKIYKEELEKDDIFFPLVQTNEIIEFNKDMADQNLRKGSAMAEQNAEPDIDNKLPPYDFSLSNLGRIKLPEKIGTLKIRRILGPGFSAVGKERVILIYTFAGEMHFTFSVDTRYFDVKKVKEIMSISKKIISDTVICE
ncbi:hypothetical protein KAJ27_19035 [bacterium]|nr:hypothetical protein [bacterium]